MHIVILSASVREGRKSHRVALYLQRTVEATANTVDLLDLAVFDFPIFHERLRLQKDPDAKTLDFAERVRKADGMIIVTPEYNGSFPASLKNVVDLLHDEWKKKPVAIATISDGSFGGTQVITSLLFSLWKIKAWVVAHMPVPKVGDTFNETGVPIEPDVWAKRAKLLLDELGWAMEARRRMMA